MTNISVSIFLFIFITNVYCAEIEQVIRGSFVMSSEKDDEQVQFASPVTASRSILWQRTYVVAEQGSPDKLEPGGFSAVVYLDTQLSQGIGVKAARNPKDVKTATPAITIDYEVTEFKGTDVTVCRTRLSPTGGSASILFDFGAQCGMTCAAGDCFALVSAKFTDTSFDGNEFYTVQIGDNKATIQTASSFMSTDEVAVQVVRYLQSDVVQGITSWDNFVPNRYKEVTLPSTFQANSTLLLYSSRHISSNPRKSGITGHLVPPDKVVFHRFEGNDGNPIHIRYQVVKFTDDIYVQHSAAFFNHGQDVRALPYGGSSTTFTYAKNLFSGATLTTEDRLILSRHNDRTVTASNCCSIWTTGHLQPIGFYSAGDTGATPQFSSLLISIMLGSNSADSFRVRGGSETIDKEWGFVGYPKWDYVRVERGSSTSVGYVTFSVIDWADNAAIPMESMALTLQGKEQMNANWFNIAPEFDSVNDLCEGTNNPVCVYAFFDNPLWPGISVLSGGSKYTVTDRTLLAQPEPMYWFVANSHVHYQSSLDHVPSGLACQDVVSDIVLDGTKDFEDVKLHARVRFEDNESIYFLLRYTGMTVKHVRVHLNGGGGASACGKGRINVVLAPEVLFSKEFTFSTSPIGLAAPVVDVMIVLKGDIMSVFIDGIEEAKDEDINWGTLLTARDYKVGFGAMRMSSKGGAVFVEASALRLNVCGNLIRESGEECEWGDAACASNCMLVPTAAPTRSPTDAPTQAPTDTPTRMPTVFPTNAPTALPTVSPTRQPSAIPSASPTSSPTLQPKQDPEAGTSVEASTTSVGSVSKVLSTTAIPTSTTSALPVADTSTSSSRMSPVETSGVDNIGTDQQRADSTVYFAIGGVLLCLLAVIIMALLYVTRKRLQSRHARPMHANSPRVEGGGGASTSGRKKRSGFSSPRSYGASSSSKQDRTMSDVEMMSTINSRGYGQNEYGLVSLGTPNVYDDATAALAQPANHYDEATSAFITGDSRSSLNTYAAPLRTSNASQEYFVAGKGKAGSDGGSDGSVYSAPPNVSNVSAVGESEYSAPRLSKVAESDAESLYSAPPPKGGGSAGTNSVYSAPKVSTMSNDGAESVYSAPKAGVSEYSAPRVQK